MEKYALIRQKRDEAIAKRTERKNRRTFPPSIFQLNPIIEPDIVEPVLEPILEPILLIEKQSETGNPLKENSIEDPIDDSFLLTVRRTDLFDLKIEDTITPALIAQAEELRKLILLQETIKRFSKKKSNIRYIQTCLLNNLPNGLLT